MVIGLHPNVTTFATKRLLPPRERNLCAEVIYVRFEHDVYARELASVSLPKGSRSEGCNPVHHVASRKLRLPREQCEYPQTSCKCEVIVVFL
jgi:hypothetical protein